MRIQMILNRVEKFKLFVYSNARLEEQEDGPALVVKVLPRKNSRPHCSGCGRPGAVYDHLPERRFELVPIWGIVVCLTYEMRRVDCKRCGVTVEMVPWGEGKNRLTTTYRWFLSTWAKRLSWSDVASIFRTSWDSVCRAVEHAVDWGLAHRDLSGLTAVGVDEVAWGRGHTHLTLDYDIGGDRKRLLAVAEERTEDGEAIGDLEVQPSVGAGVSFAGGVPEAVGVHEPGVGREVPGRMDEPRDAFAVRADEENRAHDPDSPAIDSELVSGARRGFGRRSGGAQ